MVVTSISSSKVEVNKPEPKKVSILPTLTQPVYAAKEEMKPIVTTPPPKPVVAPVAQPQGDVQSIIVKWANFYGVSSDLLLRIARCESTFNPSAVNRNYFAGGGNPSGLFQFLPETFNRYSSKAGFSGNVFNPDDNAHAAAYAFSHGGAGEWECK